MIGTEAGSCSYSKKQPDAAELAKDVLTERGSGSGKWGRQKPFLLIKYLFECNQSDFASMAGLSPALAWIGGCTLGLKSSQKRERQNENRRLRNRSYKSKTRTLIKKAFLAIEEGDLESAKEATSSAVKALDKAAAKGAIHKNNASRRKSRLMTRLAALEKGA
jgi:small subunit ribosomal protein S20